MKNNSLGKGLDALIGSEPELAETYLNVSINRLKPGAGQPRKKFDSSALDELAESIKGKGVIQPLIVRKTGQTYEIIAGERRWRAAQKAGLREIPVIVRNMEDSESVEIALIENIQREDLNPIEEALAYERLTDDFSLTHEEISERVGKSRAAVTNHLRLLKLTDKVKDALTSGKISGGHARAILGLKYESDADGVLRAMIKKGMSVRQTEALVKKMNSGGGGKTRAEAEGSEPSDIYLKQAEAQIRSELSTRVKIEGNRSKGKIVISYSSGEEFERLVFEIGSRSPV